MRAAASGRLILFPRIVGRRLLRRRLLRGGKGAGQQKREQRSR
jgi:hypothetical protein